MSITFAKGFGWDFARHAMAFTASVDGKPVFCYISAEALRDHFGAGEREMDRDYAFLRHRDEIESLARELIESGRTDSSGQVLITRAEIAAGVRR